MPHGCLFVPSSLIYLSVMLFYQPFREQSDSTLAGVTQIQLFITLFCTVGSPFIPLRVTLSHSLTRFPQVVCCLSWGPYTCAAASCSCSRTFHLSRTCSQWFLRSVVSSTR